LFGRKPLSEHRSTPDLLRSVTINAVEIVVAVGLATAAIAALQSTAPAAGLGIVYLLAVLTLAIRRGELPALIASILGVLTLNYFFIVPRHRFAIAHSQDVVELAVLLIASVVVGRLAAVARQRAAEAEERARIATAHEREATLLADTAAAILSEGSLAAQLESVGKRIAAASGAASTRVVLDPPVTRPGERAVALPSRSRNAWLCVSTKPPYDQALIERAVGPIAALIDVAVERDEALERTAETEAAKRLEAAKTAILHAISHDLRSPITAIATAGSALRTSGITARERSELIAAIEAESARLARLVDDLLDLSRIEAGAVAPQADWCDLHDVAASAAGRFRSSHPIEFSLPPDLPLVRADATQLERVFSNLIENAIKFSPKDLPVEIRGGAGPAWVTVRFIDRGRGIPLDQRGRIFEPFFRGRGTGAGGSGLGLAICQGFVEANGGRITVQSDLGHGTSFAVSFPAVPQPDGQHEPAQVHGVAPA
jgi:two-component system sensor histidine kinase KdpD